MCKDMSVPSTYEKYILISTKIFATTHDGNTKILLLKVILNLTLTLSGRIADLFIVFIFEALNT